MLVPQEVALVSVGFPFTRLWVSFGFLLGFFLLGFPKHLFLVSFRLFLFFLGSGDAAAPAPWQRGPCSAGRGDIAGAHEAQRIRRFPPDMGERGFVFWTGWLKLSSPHVFFWGEAEAAESLTNRMHAPSLRELDSKNSAGFGLEELKSEVSVFSFFF